MTAAVGTPEWYLEQQDVLVGFYFDSLPTTTGVNKFAAQGDWPVKWGELARCTDCGAQVAIHDRLTHAQWHDRLQESVDWVESTGETDY